MRGRGARAECAYWELAPVEVGKMIAESSCATAAAQQ
jgi:hypothetical protein